MSYYRLIQKERFIILIIIFAGAFLLVIPNFLISNSGHLGSIKFVYGQSVSGQVNSNITSQVNIQDVPIEKVRVGDIDIAYKMFGNGEPILLNSGAGAGMNGWDPSTPTSLSSNHTVIVFDSRGVGNTSIGSKPYSIQQLANDAAGLLDALKIKNADILGYSLGSFVAQQLAVTHPEKVDRLVLLLHHVVGKMVYLDHQR